MLMTLGWSSLFIMAISLARSSTPSFKTGLLFLSSLNDFNFLSLVLLYIFIAYLLVLPSLSFLIPNFTFPYEPCPKSSIKIYLLTIFWPLSLTLLNNRLASFMLLEVSLSFINLLFWLLEMLLSSCWLLFSCKAHDLLELLIC